MSKPESPPRRKSSTLERVTEPNVLVTYLCGYSLRTCASFLLWIDVVSTHIIPRCNSLILSDQNISSHYHYYVLQILIITFFIMAILVSSLMHFYIITQHQKNETKYTFSLNHVQILTIDLHSSSKCWEYVF